MNSPEEQWRRLCYDVAEAITNEGVNPAFHRKIMSRHRADWPVLWRRIDALMKAVDDDSHC